MTIGIIGAGHIGGNLAKLFANAGETVMVAGSGSPADVGAKLEIVSGLRVTTTDEAYGADIVVLALPWGALDKVWPHAEALRGKIVLDVTNPYKADLSGVEDLAGRTSSAVVAAHLPGAHVIKAFNTLGFKHLIDGSRPAGATDRIALAVAGDDPAAKAEVIALIEKAGFTALDAGTLAGSARQEPGQALYDKAMSESELTQALTARAA